MSFYNTAPPHQGASNSGGYGSNPNSSDFFSSQNYYAQQQPQQHQQHQQQQQQQQPTNSNNNPSNDNTNASNSMPMPMPMPNLFNPATAVKTAALFSSGNQDAIFQAGQSYMANLGAGQIQPGVGRIMGMLRVYFLVDNRYVQQKLKRVLFPFFFRSWKRQELEPIQPPPNPDGSYPPAVTQYAVPLTDENAPDLYIPLMSLITYVLLCALLFGSSGEFTPEVIQGVTTKCFVTQILEVLLIRFGFYSMQVHTTPLLDLFAYTGYKYLGLCINMLVGLLGFGRHGYYIGFVWTASSVSYFMLKALSDSIPTHTASSGPKREIMIVAFAASQFVTMWFVSQTKYLD